MKKRSILLLCCSFLGLSLYSQVAYYDALELSRLVSGNKFDPLQTEKYSGILAKYLRADSLIPNNTARVLALYADPSQDTYNPFLAPLININAGSGTAVPKAGAELINGISSLGGMDVTSIADGISKFIVRRTKEELNVTFFKKFSDELKKPEYADLKTLFPKTASLLDAIGDEIYNYQRYLQNLRQVFISDLNTLDANFPGIISNHQAFFNEHFELAVGVNSACYITRSLKEDVHPGDILENYPMEYLQKDKSNPAYFNRDWSGAIQTLQLISASLRDTSSSGSKYWVSQKQLSLLLKQKNGFLIYLGLIYQDAMSHYSSIPYEKGSFIELLRKFDFKNFNQDYTAYKNYITGFVVRAEEINTLMKEYDRPLNDSLAIEASAAYMKASVDLIEYCTKASGLPHIESTSIGNLQAEMKSYFDISYEITDLAISINRKNYPAAVNATVLVYNEVRKKPAEESARSNYSKSGKKCRDAKALDNDTAVTAANDVITRLARYGSFMSTVATAESSDDVEAAIETFALPSGSARIKRQTPFNVSLNAYSGIFLGWEQIKGVDRPACFKKGYEAFNSYGITAPIGIAISHGCRAGWSLTGFISIIDLGAVTAFRFANDSTESVPKIELKDIISPGVFFSLGLPKCPLSLNVGYQAGPLLRTVNQLENTYEKNYTRLSVSLNVDIPILNFYTKSKR
jgi:hypothetical protein